MKKNDKKIESVTLTDSLFVSSDFNAQDLNLELSWFQQVIDTRFRLYFQQECIYTDIHQVPIPDLSASDSVYAQTVRRFNMTPNERIVLLLALAPHVCPQILDVFFTKNSTYDRGFTEAGGLKGNYHSGFLPTGETAAFILSANDLSERFRLLALFDDDHYFHKYRILGLEKEKNTEPPLSGALILSQEYRQYFTTGGAFKPSFSSEFPASRLYTNLDWDDLILESHTVEEIQEILHWIQYQDQLMKEWKLEKVIKRGYRTLFYGPPGTGKTLTASLLGKSTGLEVYRIDLSKVVSKYIGETEKNLSNIFDLAENKHWILFFDEADALFGKRTSNSDAKDRYANQEVAYLLQRIEDFPGIIILASNLKTNIDDAFSRRFQSMIYFPMPKPEQRYKLWQKAFASFELEDKIDLNQIARKYELAGGAVINILRSCALYSAAREEKKITYDDLIEAIRKEFRKEGKTI